MSYTCIPWGNNARKGYRAHALRDFHYILLSSADRAFSVLQRPIEKNSSYRHVSHKRSGRVRIRFRSEQLGL